MCGGWLQMCDEKVWCVNLDLLRFTDVARVEEPWRWWFVSGADLQWWLVWVSPCAWARWLVKHFLVTRLPASMVAHSHILLTMAGCWWPFSFFCKIYYASVDFETEAVRFKYVSVHNRDIKALYFTSVAYVLVLKPRPNDQNNRDINTCLH